MLVVERMNLDTFAEILPTLEYRLVSDAPGSQHVFGRSTVAGPVTLTVDAITGDVLASSLRGFSPAFETEVLINLEDIAGKASIESADGDWIITRHEPHPEPKAPQQASYESGDVVDLDAVEGKDDGASYGRFQVALGDTVRAFTSVPADLLPQT